MKYRAHAAALVLALATSVSAWAQRCGDGRPRPDWVAQPDSSDAAHQYAAGVSDKSVASQGERLASARQNATVNLASTIEVQVRNTLITEQSRISGSGRQTLTEQQMRSFSETSTKASLQGVEVIDSWEDPATCAVWARARVPARQVEQARMRARLAMLDARLAVARDVAATQDAREGALSGAERLAAAIDFSLVPEASSSLYYQQQIGRLRGEIQSLGGDVEEARQGLRAADQALEKALAVPEVQREQYFSEVARLLRRLAARYPTGIPGLITPAALQMRIGEAEEMRGNTCGARRAYGRVPADAPQIDTARNRAASLKPCSSEDSAKEALREYIAGRPVQAHCYLLQGGVARPWPKVCDAVISYLGGMGTIAHANSGSVRPEELKRLLSDMSAPPRRGAEELPMFFVAQGEFRKRADPEAAASGSYEYQFAGTVGAIVFEGEKPAFADRFEGVTGWNPVSERMVEDVLGLNVFNRWKQRFGQFVQK